MYRNVYHWILYIWLLWVYRFVVSFWYSVVIVFELLKVLSQSKLSNVLLLSGSAFSRLILQNGSPVKVLIVTAADLFCKNLIKVIKSNLAQHSLSQWNRQSIIFSIQASIIWGNFETAGFSLEFSQETNYTEINTLFLSWLKASSHFSHINKRHQWAATNTETKKANYIGLKDVELSFLAGKVIPKVIPKECALFIIPCWPLDGFTDWAKKKKKKEK